MTVASTETWGAHDLPLGAGSGLPVSARGGDRASSLPARRVPFSLVDEAIDHLDSPAEPWSVQLEARVAGALDEGRLRAAVAAALDRHPRARARRIPPRLRDRRYEWEILPAAEVDPMDVLITQDDAGLAAARAELQSRPLPLDVSPPLRVRLARHPAGDVVMLYLHHAAGDGVSAVRLLRSIVDSYAGRPEAATTVLPMASYDHRVLAPPHGARPAEHPPSGALRAELRQWAARSSRLASEGGLDAPGYGFHQVALTTEQTRALVFGGPREATVNDVLMAALHLAIESWNRDHGVPRARVAVLMPVNLRAPEWGHDVFGNFSFPVPVATSSADRATPLAALRAVAARTRGVKKGRSAAAPLAPLARLQQLPVGVRRPLARALARGPLVPAAMLSNLGRLEPPLDFGVDMGRAGEVWFSPPARLPLGLAVGAVTAEGHLHLSFRYRHPLLGPAAAAGFAGRYLEALDELTSATLS